MTQLFAPSDTSLGKYSWQLALLLWAANEESKIVIRQNDNYI